MTLADIMSSANAFVWGPIMLASLVGTGVYLTIRIGFLQIIKLPKALKIVFSRPISEDAAGDISPVQALTTALAATIGTGNIAGVATAIFLGGPGAIFWMWVCAFFGMATKYAEAVLAVKYRNYLPDGPCRAAPCAILQKAWAKNGWAGFLRFSAALPPLVSAAWFNRTLLP